MFLGTSKAKWAAVVTRTVSGRSRGDAVNLKQRFEGNEEEVYPGLTDKGLPSMRVLNLPPGVRPAHHHSIGLHPTKAAGLNHVTDPLVGFLSHDALSETLHSLMIHLVLQSLMKKSTSHVHLKVSIFPGSHPKI